MDLPLSTRFLVDYATALTDHGAPADMVEDRVGAVAHRLNLPVAILATPTALLLSVADGQHPYAELVRVRPSEVNIRTLEGLEVLGATLSAGRLTLDEARHRLHGILSEPPPFSVPVELVAWSVVSGCFARMLGGGLPDMLVATMFGGVIGAIALASQSRPSLERVRLPMSATLASAGAAALSRAGAGIDPDLTAVAALVMLLPGFSVTVGTRELAEGHWIAGTARLAGATLALASLALGAAVGAELIGRGPAPAPQLSGVSLSVALVAVAPAFAVLLRARVQDMGVILAACVTTWVMALGSRGVLEGPLAAGVAAAGMTVLAHLWARHQRRPAALWKVPGLLMLVPGSLGFRSLGGLLSGQTLTGVDQAATTLLSAAALSIGLLVGAGIVPLDDRHVGVDG